MIQINTKQKEKKQGKNLMVLTLPHSGCGRDLKTFWLRRWARPCDHLLMVSFPLTMTVWLVAIFSLLAMLLENFVVMLHRAPCWIPRLCYNRQCWFQESFLTYDLLKMGVRKKEKVNSHGGIRVYSFVFEMLYKGIVHQKSRTLYLPDVKGGWFRHLNWSGLCLSLPTRFCHCQPNSRLSDGCLYLPYCFHSLCYFNSDFGVCSFRLLSAKMVLRSKSTGFLP